MFGLTALLALAIVVGMLLLQLALVVVSGFIIMLVWNAMAPVFWAAAPHITFFQGILVAAGIAILRGLLVPSVHVENKQ